MAEFICQAEKKANSITEISDFSGFSLINVKESVEELSSLIGRTDDIFLSYSKHDISHINKMLEYLDWIIPPSTRDILTSADWLLITLSIYFHDLGMLITQDEYDNRYDNLEFRTFIEEIKNGKSSDFHARTKKMNEKEKDKFFFEEFIRKKHPIRIRKWINGSYKNDQSDELKKIGKIIEDTISELPSRFKTHLATVCASHHKEDLSNKEKYPLYQSYTSNEDQATANVQYAALILRSVDLLHVTKDRTPSVMYKLINFTDPKSVEEWDKQSGTFSVDHKKRKFDPDDKNTHIIQISADFDKEEPFFSLSEYIAYANKQIKKTQRWAEEAKSDVNAKKYWFPWKKIEGDLRVQADKPEKLKFEFNRGSLLDLLVGHAIYNDPRVALRELMQNSIDAVRFQTFKDKKNNIQSNQSEILVKWNPKSRSLTITDNGTGMDRYTIQNHLMSVGSSYYSTSKFSTLYSDFNPISRFGIGILTCFMVSDDIEIFTFKNNEGHRVKMKSVHGNYLLRSISPSNQNIQDIKPHGTKIQLQLRDNIDLTEKSILEILETWVVLPECKVSYQEVGKEKTKSVGYNTTEEVLQEKLKSSGRDLSKIKIVTKSEESEDMIVDISYAIYDSERFTNNYISNNREFRPILTLEGVKVTNRIPWVGRFRSLLMVVSVRGSKELRTTVSRSGLEKDQHFDKLGRICIELLYEHTQDELQSIISSKGSPLSKASSVYNTLWATIADQVMSSKAMDLLEELRSEEKIIVIENSQSDGSKNIAERKLISPNELKNMDEFWTSESRLIDSLGTISRDLGTELSLSKLLSSLDIDYHERFPTPILPDAQLFTEDLLSDHIPTHVDFSKEKQQTSIKWKKKGDHTDFIKLIENTDEKIIEEANEIYKENYFGSSRRGDVIDNFIKKINRIHVSEIKGDDSNIKVVDSRIVTVFKLDTIAAKDINKFKKIIPLATKNKNSLIMGKAFVLVEILDTYVKYMSGYEGYRRGSKKQLENEWQRISHDLNTWLSQENNKLSVHNDITSLFDTEEIFNVSQYWTNWNKANQ